MTQPLTADEFDRIAAERPCRGLQHRDAYSDLTPRMPKMKGEILRWFQDALRDEERKWVAAAILAIKPDSARPLVKNLLTAGLKEADPSLNRAFVTPLEHVSNWPEIVDFIIEAADQGDNLIRGGVGRLAYWLRRDIPGYGDEPISQLNSWMILEFCRNDDLVVRRCLIPQLRLDGSNVDDEAREKIPDVTELARKSGDEYINQRLDIHLGNHSGSFMPLNTSR